MVYQEDSFGHRGETLLGIALLGPVIVNLIVLIFLRVRYGHVKEIDTAKSYTKIKTALISVGT